MRYSHRARKRILGLSVVGGGGVLYKLWGNYSFDVHRPSTTPNLHEAHSELYNFIIYIPS